ARRGARTAEYVEAMRALWADDVASFGGEFVEFDDVRTYPKPVRDRRIPIVLGGNTDTALRRAAAVGDGWYGFNVPLADVPGRVAVLQEAARRQGRNPGELSVAVRVPDVQPGHLPALAAAGGGGPVL